MKTCFWFSSVDYTSLHNKATSVKFKTKKRNVYITSFSSLFFLGTAINKSSAILFYLFWIYSEKSEGRASSLSICSFALFRQPPGIYTGFKVALATNYVKKLGLLTWEARARGKHDRILVFLIEWYSGLFEDLPT